MKKLINKISFLVSISAASLELGFANSIRFIIWKFTAMGVKSITFLFLFQSIIKHKIKNRKFVH